MSTMKNLLSTYTDEKGVEHEAIFLTWSQVRDILGRDHEGSSDDDRRLISVLRSLGAPSWIEDAEGWIDAEGWGLIGPYIARMTSFDTESGWAEGIVGPYRWQAKVYEEGSEFGINGGRISKLTIWDEKKRTETSDFFAACIVNYDRGWDIVPETAEAQQALEAVLKLCEEEG